MLWRIDVPGQTEPHYLMAEWMRMHADGRLSLFEHRKVGEKDGVDVLQETDLAVFAPGAWLLAYRTDCVNGRALARHKARLRDEAVFPHDDPELEVQETLPPQDPPEAPQVPAVEPEPEEAPDHWDLHLERAQALCERLGMVKWRAINKHRQDLLNKRMEAEFPGLTREIQEEQADLFWAHVEKTLACFDMEANGSWANLECLLRVPGKATTIDHFQRALEGQYDKPQVEGEEETRF